MQNSSVGNQKFEKFLTSTYKKIQVVPDRNEKFQICVHINLGYENTCAKFQIVMLLGLRMKNWNIIRKNPLFRDTKICHVVSNRNKKLNSCTPTEKLPLLLARNFKSIHPSPRPQLSKHADPNPVSTNPGTIFCNKNSAVLFPMVVVRKVKQSCHEYSKFCVIKTRDKILNFRCSSLINNSASR